jgi:putative transposase
VEKRFKQLVKKICQENGWEILAMEVMPDHCCLFLNSLPTDSSSDLMAKWKGVTSRKRRQEFKRSQSLTRFFFVSTGSSETIRRSVEELKKRG